MKQVMTRTCSVLWFDWKVKRGKKNGQNSQVQLNIVMAENGFICSICFCISKHIFSNLTIINNNLMMNDSSRDVLIYR